MRLLVYDLGMDEREEILTTAAAARLLGISPITMAKWIALGHFPNAYRLNPLRTQSAWRIPMADVKTFVQKRREQQGWYRVSAVSGGSELLTGQPGHEVHRP